MEDVTYWTRAWVRPSHPADAGGRSTPVDWWLVRRLVVPLRAPRILPPCSRRLRTCEGRAAAPEHLVFKRHRHIPPPHRAPPHAPPPRTLLPRSSCHCRTGALLQPSAAEPTLLHYTAFTGRPSISAASPGWLSARACACVPASPVPCCFRLHHIRRLMRARSSRERDAADGAGRCRSAVPRRRHYSGFGLTVLGVSRNSLRAC